MKEPLGTLEQLTLQDAWETEAGHFTPWLAREENLALLSRALEMDLELVGQEQGVGPFRADIVCRDTADRSVVLIENQLARTDHCHLGQLMTYAAGLEAVKVIWIAQRFMDEHRAALDWLNHVTDSRANFFGLEIELWRIGDSPAAPKFNIVVKPKEKLPAPDLTDAPRLYLEYWTALREHLQAQGSPIRIGTPLAQMWMNFAVGRGGFCLTVVISKQKKFIDVRLDLYDPERLAQFAALAAQRIEIEQELGPLDWRQREEKTQSQIGRTFDDTDPADVTDWPRQHESIRKTLETFRTVFGPRVKALDASESMPDILGSEPRAALGQDGLSS